MPRPALRSRTVKRKIVRTPGGRHVVHVLPKKHDVPKCAVCGSPLNGFPKMTIKEERKGHRPPSRIFGGYLCSRCLRMGLKEAVRLQFSA